MIVYFDSDWTNSNLGSKITWFFPCILKVSWLGDHVEQSSVVPKILVYGWHGAYYDGSYNDR